MGDKVMHVPFFDLGSFIKLEKSAIMSSLERVVDSGTYIGGDEVSSFEEEFSSSIGGQFTVGVGNGLDALRLILEAHDIGSGDEVIVPGFTFYATWLAVMQAGAQPIPVDVQLEDACIDPSLIEAAISSRTRAILVVHLFGNPVDMASVNKIAKAHGLLVFEDCAQAHGCITNAGPAGASGDGAGFSFYPTKNLGALGDAGAVTTGSEQIALRLKSLRSYGVGKTKYEHDSFGWNSRLDPMQAAILRNLLPKLGLITERRRQIAGAYLAAFAQTEIKPVVPLDHRVGVFHHFVFRSKNRIDLQSQLAEIGVSTDIHYPYFFNSIQPVIAPFLEHAIEEPTLPNSRTLSEEVVSLPMGPWMQDDQVVWVSEAIKRINAFEK